MLARRNQQNWPTALLTPEHMLFNKYIEVKEFTFNRCS